MPEALRSEVAEASFFRQIGYSTVWEDDRVVSEGLAPAAGERVLSVTSGGCFSLQMLLADVEDVLSIDFSPHQTALLELKAAAAGALEHGELWELLGHRPSRRRAALYRRAREALAPGARAYWDARPALVERGLALCGRQDRYLHAVGRFLRLLQGERRVRDLLACPDLEAQRRYFHDDWSTRRWRALCGVLFSQPVLDRAFHKDHFRFARGIDPATAFRAEIERMLRDVPVGDNHYLHYLFTGTYPSDERCPPWLRRSSFARLRARLPRLRPTTGELERTLFELPARSIDCFNFSNVFDWVTQEAFEALMRQVVRVARPGARLCYWTNLVNRQRELVPERLPEIAEDRALGARIFAANRTPGYSSCVVARVTVSG